MPKTALSVLILCFLALLVTACAKQPRTWAQTTYSYKLATEGLANIRFAQRGESPEQDALYAKRRAYAEETAVALEQRIFEKAGSDHDAIYRHLSWGNFDCEAGEPSRCQSVTYIYPSGKDFFGLSDLAPLHCVLWDVTFRRAVERGRNAIVTEQEIPCPSDG